MESFFEKPHRRLNLLTGEYVLVSPQRTKRPWLGMVELLPGRRPAGVRSRMLPLPRQRTGGRRPQSGLRGNLPVR